ncbi:extracellular solute-binding protein (family 5), partial [Keratinibaculum paraultunense]
MKRKLALLLALVLLLSVFTAACGKEEPTDVKKEEEKVADEPKEGSDGDIDDEQYITLTITEPQAIDPSTSNDIYSGDILNEITEGLGRLETGEDGGDIIVPAGAEDWDVSDDGLVWTFHLRDYEWEDGEPVTAHDFEYGIKRNINPETAAVFAYLLYPIKNAEACNSGEKDLDELGVKALDDKTLEITLEKPCAYFDKFLPHRIMYPQRKDLVEQWGDKVGSEAEYTISCGPFKLTEWTHKSELVLEKNENYWDADNVKLEKITYKVIEDPSTAYNMLSNG